MLRAKLAAAETKIEAWKIVLDFLGRPYYTSRIAMDTKRGGCISAPAPIWF